MVGVEPFPFAEVSDLQARWPDMPPGAQETAGVLLEDASQFILDVAPESVEAPEGTRRRIVCAVVRRSMAVGDMAGMSSVSQLAGSFQQQVSPANPHGDFYLTKLEKRALGVGRQRAFEVDLLAGSRRARGDSP